MAGPLLTLLAAFVLEAAVMAGLRFLDPGTVLLSLVVLVATFGGMRAGLVSAAVALFYLAYTFSLPELPFRYSREGAARVIETGILIPGLALLIGWLRDRIESLIVDERRLRASAEEEEQWCRFLATTSRILGSSLDYEQTLTAVADLAVPQLGDYCVVDVVENGSVRRVQLAHASPEMEELAAEYRERFPPDRRHDTALWRVLESGRPVLIPSVPDAFLREVARSTEHLEFMRAAAVRSLMILPMTARGRTTGAMTFVIGGDSDRVYDAVDLARATDLASRAALAIDNARLYAEAQTANRAKSEFLAVISHELRTPLNAIIGYADLLEGHVAGTLNDAQRRQVSRLRVSAYHLLELIEEVLSFARLDAAREEVEATMVRIDDLVREAASIVAPQARDKELEFRVETDAIAGRTVVTDPAKLRRILLNLLSNAVKFTQQGEVVVDAELGKDDVAFRVRDTGPGVAVGDRERIFEPFVQIEPATTREVGGTGLGLAVARQLARVLGGDVELDTVSGRGSTFTVRLPRRPRAGAAARARAAAGP